MTKIFDCSNSEERPSHRGNGGPRENDIIRYLKTYCSEYGCSFVDDVKKADVLLTNDVFPKSIVDISIPKVKRMDGVFFQEAFKERNDSLNYSAEKADHVIFISDFSRDSFFNLYTGKEIKSHSVIKNEADPSVFHIKQRVNKPILSTLLSSATDWSREEKRLQDIIVFSKLFPRVTVYLIGNYPGNLPFNVIPCGYISDPKKIAECLNSTQAFINFSYKDACPKTVAQAVSCGLPIFYANSGGVPEQVYSGVGISDSQTFCFEDTIPRLNKDEIFEKGLKFLGNYRRLKESANCYKNVFTDMLEGYFNVLKGF